MFAPDTNPPSTVEVNATAIGAQEGQDESFWGLGVGIPASSVHMVDGVSLSTATMNHKFWLIAWWTRGFGSSVGAQEHYISAIHFFPPLKGTTDYKMSSLACNTSSNQPSVPEQLNTFLTFLQDTSSSGRGPDPDSSASSPRSEQPLCSLKLASQEEHYTASTAIKQIGLIASSDVYRAVGHWAVGRWTASCSIHRSMCWEPQSPSSSPSTTVEQLQVTCSTNRPTDDGNTFMRRFTDDDSSTELCMNLCIKCSWKFFMLSCFSFIIDSITN